MGPPCSRGRSPARMRPGDSPGPRRPFVGSGWTRTDRSERVLLAGSARARARDPRLGYCTRGPSKDWADPGTHWHGPPPWAPAADGSSVRLPQHTRSLSSLRDASASNQLASDCRLQPLGSQMSIPASPSCCVLRCPGCRRPATTTTCPR
jgi:hypothetical protein